MKSRLIMIGLSMCLLGLHAEVYSTWNDSLEPDKCATAWLIKRFVDKGATFELVPRGTLKMPGIPFDVPTAELRPSSHQSAFELALKHFKLSNPSLVQIGHVIRDIEINKWDTKKTAEAGGIIRILRGYEVTFNDRLAGLEASFVIFDGLYAAYAAELEGKK